ncbi:MAG: hypothetical protein JKX84_05210, partial [Flavobacteriales bacterium]|nr:hypothetical protein [Flavobacteriales bacterium]
MHRQYFFLRSFLTVVLLAAVTSINAQDNVGIGTVTPHPSAMVDINAQDKGLLIPRTDTLSITDPATGLLIYTAVDSSFWYYDGILWRRGVGPQGPVGPLLPATEGQTMRYDELVAEDWVANSFIWNNEFHVGVNTDLPDSSAVLHLVSEDKGFLAPQMTSAQRDAIENPAVGLVVANITTGTVDYYNGECWLPTFAEDCNACFLDVVPSSTDGEIDRVVSPSVDLDLDITQTIGAPQQLVVSILTALPDGVTAIINPNPAPSTGVVNVEFSATPFAPDGTFPIVIQVLCGSSTYNIIYTLTILPCYVVDVTNSTDNYNLGVEFYITHPNAPTAEPVCLVNNIAPGVLVGSTDATLPAYTTGTGIPTGSLVALVNDGAIIGRGGDGGDATIPNQGLTGDGQDGGDAIDLTLDVDIYNNAYIFGGGGGGPSMAFAVSTSLPPPVNIPIGFFIGSGGGGGAGLGEGGTLPNGIIGLTFYEEGTDGTGGQPGLPGQ